MPLSLVAPKGAGGYLTSIPPLAVWRFGLACLGPGGASVQLARLLPWCAQALLGCLLFIWAALLMIFVDLELGFL